MTAPTYEDANVLLQIAQWWAAAGVGKDLNWIWSDEFDPDYEAFIEKHPGPGHMNVALPHEKCSFQLLGFARHLLFLIFNGCPLKIGDA